MYSFLWVFLFFLRMLSTYKKSVLEKKIRAYIEKNPKVVTFCFGKKRPVFLTKYLEATLGRIDVTRRLRLFDISIRDLKKALPQNVIQNSENEYAVHMDKTKVPYALHIREEIDRKDRKLYLISTFEK